MSVDRRELFRIIGAGVVAVPALPAQHTHAPSTQAPTAVYTPRALTPEQYSALGQFLEVLLPADDISPSAREAGVAAYIDTTLHYADEPTRTVWKSGIDAVGREAAGQDLTAALSRIAENEQHPATDAERFFVTFKQAAIVAYYSSEGGRKSLGYTGDTAIRDFPGCTHANHKA
jgi:hypothetical protein